jgi:hypothetical protein
MEIKAGDLGRKQCFSLGFASSDSKPMREYCPSLESEESHSLLRSRDPRSLLSASQHTKGSSGSMSRESTSTCLTGKLQRPAVSFSGHLQHTVVLQHLVNF